ncbi:MAG: hypothetical protein QOI86_2664 [Actinomycetota bacterium]|nr:hypothetical protein [Actinomycetota bacterium]
MTEAPRPTKGELKADLKAEKARAKALRPWYKKKKYIIPLAVVALIVAIKATSGGSSGKSSQPGSVAKSGTEARLFPGRVDAQSKDHERNIGQGADLVGYTATVKSAGFQQSVSQFEKNGYVAIDVTVLNRNSGSQPYNTFDWKLQTPGGQVIDPGITSGQSLGSGDLVSGGNVSGKVVFEVGTQKGDFFVIYKPKAFDSSRGIWKVTV